VLETTDVSRNYSAELISELPVRRNIVDTVLLSPGVNNSGEPARAAARSLH
jgi:hypothetical protein